MASLVGDVNNHNLHDANENGKMIVSEDKDQFCLNSNSSNSSVSSMGLNPRDLEVNDDGSTTENANLQFSFTSGMDYEDLPSEETLENLLKNSSSPYLTESNNKPKNSFEEDDDEINAELSKLAAAEEDVRMELEMLMTTGFHNENALAEENEEESIFTSATNDNDAYSLSQVEGNDYNDQPTSTPFSTPTTTKTKKSNRSLENEKQDSIESGYEIFSTPTSQQSSKSEGFTPSMTNEDYLKLMKSRCQMQADEIGLGKIFVKDHRSSLRGCHTCPLLAHNTIQKLNIAKEITSSPKLSPQQQEILVNSNFEYLQPMPSHYLRQIYAGLILPQPKSKRNNSNPNNRSMSTIEESQSQAPHKQAQSSSRLNDPIDPTEALPLRTCGLRIRPDVLCGAVMDTVSHAVHQRNGEIVKRQGGHMMAKVPGFWLQLKDRTYKNKINRNSNQTKRKKRKIWLPPFCFDAQLCTKKKNGVNGGIHSFERILLIRVFEMSIEGNKKSRNRKARSSTILDPSDVTTTEYGKENNEKVKEKGSDEQDILKQAAYIVYQMEQVDEQEKQTRLLGTSKTPLSGTDANANLPGITSSKFKGRKHDPGVVSQIGNILTSPIRIIANSTVDAPEKLSKKFIPALSVDYNHFLQSAFRFFTVVINELETRELSFTSLIGNRFGGFPALPTLDTNYCSQLRLLCRETMILNLLETASGLEQYARDMEKNCVEFSNILSENVMKEYAMKPPVIPKMVPLNAYPLDFRPPEAAHPPWGQKVKVALEQISRETSSIMNMEVNHSPALSDPIPSSPLPSTETKSGESATSDYEGTVRADEAVKLVVDAFVQQFDEEQCARLARKNMQVMDRMAKMQALKRDTVIRIQDAYGRNMQATAAAKKFQSMVSRAKVPQKRNMQLIPSSENSNKCETQQPVELSSNDQVPLLKCGILIGGSSGTCYVTSKQVLFTTQSIPIVGGIECTLINIADTEFILAENPRPSLIFKSPLNVLSVRLHRSHVSRERNNSLSWIIENTDEVFSFVPSIGSRRFIKVIDMIKSVGLEDPETLKFSPKGGLIYMADESNVTGPQSHDEEKRGVV